MRLGSRAFTVATASRIRSRLPCCALPFVENDRNATRGSALRKIRVFSAASRAISASCGTVGEGTTAQSAKTRPPFSPKAGLGRLIRKKLETVDDDGFKPRQ